MELTVTEMYDLYKGQEAYDAQKNRVFKLSLLMVSNSKKLKARLETFEETRKELLDSEEYVAYATKRQKIIDSHRIKKTDGSFETTMQQGQLVYKLDNVKELEDKLNAFDAEEGHAELIEKNKNGMKEVEAAMEEKHEIDLRGITTPTQVQALELKTLVILAPIIKVKLTEEVLGATIAESLTVKDLQRLENYCAIE